MESGNRLRPVHAPMQRSTAARLSLHQFRQPQLAGIVRLEKPVSDEKFVAVQLMFATHTRLPAGYYTFLQPDEPAPAVLRSPAYHAPWWRQLVGRSWW